MIRTGKLSSFGIVAVAALAALGLLTKSITGQSVREADGARLLRGAIDMHFHMDAPAAAGPTAQAAIATVSGRICGGCVLWLSKTTGNPRRRWLTTFGGKYPVSSCSAAS